MFLARSVTGLTEDGLFLQTAKGQAVLQQVKDFMKQYVLPAQEVSAKSWQEQKSDLFAQTDRGTFNLHMKGFDRAYQLIHAVRTNSFE